MGRHFPKVIEKTLNIIAVNFSLISLKNGRFQLYQRIYERRIIKFYFFLFIEYNY